MQVGTKQFLACDATWIGEACTEQLFCISPDVVKQNVSQFDKNIDDVPLDS